ncbi:anti-sigma factor [Pseudomonas sp. 3A(2025)]
MNDTELPPGNDPDLLIAEYVLGVLSSEERAQVEALAARDPRYQAQIAAWQQHFSHWLEQIPPVSPPAQAWQGIERRLFPAPTAAATPASHWWNDLRLWRWTTATLAAGLLVAVFTLQQPIAPPVPTLLARLEQGDGNALFAATVYSDGRSVLFVPNRAADWQGKSAQAWLIGADGMPHSLGLLPDNTAVTLTLPPGLAGTLARDAVLAVSLEPVNGSPTGLPTGPVIAQGKIISL